MYLFLNNIGLFLQPKTKKFIDKKSAVTFNLVHRSQKDPLAADEDAPQRVLVPIGLRDEKASGDAASSSKTNISKVSSTLEFFIF